MKNLVYLTFLTFFISSFTLLNSVNVNKNSVLEPLKLSIQSKGPTSIEKNDGSLDVTVSGGTAPYTVQVISTYNLPADLFKKNHIELNKIGIGTYLILVQDADKHIVQETIELKVQ